MIPAVRKPYCAGRAPVINATELASRVCKRLAEDVDPLRQLNPVDAELQIGVVAADMDLAERILGNAGRLQQQLVQRLIVALRLGLDRLPAEIVDGGAEAGLDLLARDVELLGDHLEVERQASFGRRRRLLRGCRARRATMRRGQGKGLGARAAPPRKPGWPSSSS